MSFSVVKLLAALASIFFCTLNASVHPESQNQNNVPSSVATQQHDSSTYSDSVHWVPYENGTKISKDSGKPIFLFCYGSWCGYSQKMLARTFHDSTVVKYLNNFFTPVRIETQSHTKSIFQGIAMTESQIANQQFGVTAVPCMWLLESNGCRIKKVKGYYPAKYLLPELQAIHDHTYGDCKNVPLTEISPPPNIQKSSTGK